MLKNYIVTILRGIRRNKLFTIINLTGLSIAMACFILVGLYVRYELSYDQFHDKVEDIHIVKLKYNEEMGGFGNHLVPAVLGKHLREEIPELEEVTITSTGVGSMYLVTREEEFIKEKYYQVEPSFFKMFNFPFLYGDKAKALSDPKSIVISKEIALKYFGKENIVGEIIKVDGKGEFRVSGVLKPFPNNSQFQPNFVFPIEAQYDPESYNSWGYATFFVYVKTLPNTDLELLKTKIWSVYERNVSNNKFFAGAELGSFADSYWQLSGSGASMNNRDRGLGANKDVIYICSGMALLLLFIALANYVNMATAKAMERAKEVGIRKVNGATKNQLIKQFLGETLFFSMLCLVVAVILVELLLPTVSQIMGITLKMQYQEPSILFFLIGYSVLCGLLAGIYPAILLSNFNPVEALKGQKQIANTRFSHRNILLFFQFTISSVMIAVLLIANVQIKHYVDFDLGFEKERIVSIRMTDEMRKIVPVILQKIKNVSGVEAVTMGSMPGGASGFNTLEYEAIRLKNIPRIQTNEDFLSLFKIPLLEGRNFDPARTSDFEKGIIINSALVKQMGLENPVGTTILFSKFPKEIIGVMADFYVSGAMSNIRPLILSPVKDKAINLLIKVSSENMAGTLDQIDEIWNLYDYKNAYQYQFLDDAYETKLDLVKRITLIINGVTVAIVAISLFGLFSLVVFQTSQKVKEIGIRKVLGASVSHILLILSKPYALVVLLSTSIAIPLAYSFMDDALNKFPNRINIDSSFGIATIAFVLLFSGLVVLSRGLAASRRNPVEILRNE